MTLLSKILLFFPAIVLLLTGGSLIYFAHSPGIFSAVVVLFSLYGLPVFIYQLHQWIYPIKEGISYLQGKEYSHWWGSHQIQVIYIAIPVLEAVLRLIPGVFSGWLRLWGAKIGQNIYHYVLHMMKERICVWLVPQSMYQIILLRLMLSLKKK